MADVKHNVEADLRELVATILEVEPDTIDEQASFVKDLGMDSMMALEVLASIEKKYKIIIPEETLAKFTSLSQTVKIVQNMLEKK
jgi:acyl carrier protein